MAEDNEYSGRGYGDDTGVTFYGPPANGFWSDAISISDSYIAPIFRAILDQPLRGTISPPMPKLIMDWNCERGWRDASGIVEISRQDAEEFLTALLAVSTGELQMPRGIDSPERYLHCAAHICTFLQS